jgi:hypothetical protein
MCARKIMTGEYWVCEHMVAICNGGENRESNLNLTCRNCVPRKNAADLAEKSRVNRIRSKHLGIKQTKRPFPKCHDPWGKERRANSRDSGT